MKMTYLIRLALTSLNFQKYRLRADMWIRVGIKEYKSLWKWKRRMTDLETVLDFGLRSRLCVNDWGIRVKYYPNYLSGDISIW